VHGTIGSAASWRLVAPLLESRFAVVTMDRRGRGESTDGTADYSADLDASDVRAVIAELGEPVHLVGHSYGAVVVLHVATDNPAVRSLTLYEPMLAWDRLPLALETAAQRLEELARSGDAPAAAGHWLRTLVAIGLFEAHEVDALMANPEVWQRFVAAVPTVPREVRAGRTNRPLCARSRRGSACRCSASWASGRAFPPCCTDRRAGARAARGPTRDHSRSGAHGDRVRAGCGSFTRRGVRRRGRRRRREMTRRVSFDFGGRSSTAAGRLAAGEENSAGAGHSAGR
jgi:pimeloyl-ACP methyl ester carboxylesterase